MIRVRTEGVRDGLTRALVLIFRKIRKDWSGNGSSGHDFTKIPEEGRRERRENPTGKHDILSPSEGDLIGCL